MKQYVSAEEYRALGGRIPADTEDDVLDGWLRLASVKVDKMALWRIGELEKLAAWRRELVQLATVAQADCLYEADAGGGLGEGISGYSVADVSVSFGGGSAAAGWRREHNLSPAALDYLDAAGLTWRGV